MQTQLKTNHHTSYASKVLNEILKSSSNDIDFEESNSYVEIIENFSSNQIHNNTRYKSYHVLSYENTKNMTAQDVSKYFPNAIEEEKSHIRFMINISNNFSKNDMVNKAVFEEIRFMTDINERIEFSLGLALEKENFFLKVPALHDVLLISDEWTVYTNNGGQNGAASGIFMNEQHEARYKHNKAIKYKKMSFSQDEATDFLITMKNLAKESYEKSMDEEFEEDYKLASQRYDRLYESYLGFLMD